MNEYINQELLVYRDKEAVIVLTVATQAAALVHIIAKSHILIATNVSDLLQFME